jgi:Ran-binding protein 9/10
MPPPVPIPSSSSSRSTSRLENVLASFEDPRGLRFRRDSGHHRASLSQSTVPAPISGSTASVTPPAYSLSHTASSSYQPRVVRASSSAVATGLEPSFVTRHSISPTRHRTHSSNLLSRSQPAPRPHSAALRAQSSPFTPPAYLSHTVLSDLFHGGSIPPQSHTPEIRATPEASSPMTDSDDSLHGETLVSGIRRRHRNASPKELVSWPTVLPLPTQWSENDKSPHLTVSPNGREVSFNGAVFTISLSRYSASVGHSNTLDTRDAAAVRADCPIPPACGIYYYEVTVLDRGNKGYIY